MNKGKYNIFVFPLIFFLLIFSSSAKSKDLKPSNNLFGVPGILDMPSASSFDDGQISFTSAKFGPNFRNTLAFQAFPRVLTTFRFTGIGDIEKYYYSDSGYTTWDRSFDLRFDLLKENNNSFIPSITTGLQDIVGTGLYSAEYLVMSKSLLGNIIATGGLGWGRLGTRNLITRSSDRLIQNNYTGGTLRLKQAFRGNIGAFGGLEYFPTSKYKLKLELSSDSYSNDQEFSKLLPSSRINYGVDYYINKHTSISAFYLNGNHGGFQLNLSLNPNTDTVGDFLEGTPEPFYSIPYPVNEKDPKYWEKVTTNLKQENIDILSYKELENEVLVVINNAHYSSHIQAVGRTLRVLSKYIPLKFSLFNVILSDTGIPITKITIDRHELSEIIDAPNAELITSKIVKIESAPVKIFETNAVINNSRYDWKLTPYGKVHLFDPSKPVYWDTGIRIRNSYQIKPGFFIEGQIEKSVFSEFDQIYRGIKGRLPFVRTNQSQYLRSNKNARLNYLMLNSYYRMPSEIYGRFTLGYLEEMYGGSSAELLYAPYNQDYALGLELNYLKPREFKQEFGFRSIAGMSNLNGHISGYWDTNFYNYLAQVDYGKYLAGDIGSTLTLTRNFPNGWQVGGFFTITNATYEQFGEGSFDKGFFFRVPFNPFNPYETRSGFSQVVRPLSGDGGARVNLIRLYDLVSDYSNKSLKRTWPRIWR